METPDGNDRGIIWRGRLLEMSRYGRLGRATTRVASHLRTAWPNSKSVGLSRAPWLVGLVTLALSAMALPRLQTKFSPDRLGACYIPRYDLIGLGNHLECYTLMAQHPNRAPIAPYAFRVLSPWLVHLLPLPTAQGFALLSVMSVAGAVAVMYVLVRDEVGWRTGLLAAGLLWIGPGWAVLDQPQKTDGITVLACVVVLWLAERNQWWIAATVLAVAVMNHEFAVLIAVGLVAVAWPSRRLRGLLLVAPMLSVYAALHFTPLLYGHFVPGVPLAANLREVIAYDAPQGIGAVARSAVTSSLGLGWVFTVLGWQRAPHLYRRGMVCGLPALASWVVAADWARALLVPAAFAVPIACRAVWRPTADASV